MAKEYTSPELCPIMQCELMPPHPRKGLMTVFCSVNPLPGEGTHKRKSNRRTYSQQARRVPWEAEGLQWKKRHQPPKTMQEMRKMNYSQQFRVG